MKSAIGYWSVVILTIIGGFQVLMWAINGAERIDALFNDSTKYELQREKHEEYANAAYSRGRVWGEIAAVYYTDNSESINVSGTDTDKAEFMIDKRIADTYCWGADDCGELPTDEELMDHYYLGNITGNMPVQSFRSGFIDSFNENLHLISKLNIN